MSETNIPAELRYTAEHEWVQRTGSTTVRVGITDFAQSQLGDVVFVQLPAVDDETTAGESFGEVESTKSVSDIYSPLNAKVVAANGDLDSAPELVNSAPYGGGWLVELEVADEPALDAALAAMLDPDAYRELTGE
ncbi:glycine cleavage system protein GcvH [Rhodococcus sp. Q]|uniref:glycine cleavage system protein GcvH n=1 Tax=Rhodococcus sp. Q TaxID=2502252 RepID=UPI0010F93171|nr:glycine cleavage system protein GcvH [Rhodococcus sp. Q]